MDDCPNERFEHIVRIKTSKMRLIFFMSLSKFQIAVLMFMYRPIIAHNVLALGEGGD
jgi:hypothetical protein